MRLNYNDKLCGFGGHSLRATPFVKGCFHSIFSKNQQFNQTDIRTHLFAAVSRCSPSSTSRVGTGVGIERYCRFAAMVRAEANMERA